MKIKPERNQFRLQIKLNKQKSLEHVWTGKRTKNTEVRQMLLKSQLTLR